MLKIRFVEKEGVKNPEIPKHLSNDYFFTFNDKKHQSQIYFEINHGMSQMINFIYFLKAQL